MGRLMTRVTKMAIVTTAALSWSTFTWSFDFDYTNYSVYESLPASDGSVTIYVVPKAITWLIGNKHPIVYRYPANPAIGGGFVATLYSNGSLGTFSKTSLHEGNMLGLNTVASSYRLYGGDFDGDGKPDLLLRGIGSRDSVALTADTSGNPLTYYNFNAQLNAIEKSVAVYDADGNGRSDIALTGQGVLTRFLSNSQSATFSISGPSAIVDNFPRLGNVLIGAGGSTAPYNADYQAWAAKIHINILGYDSESTETTLKFSKASVIEGIKSQSQISSRVFQYVNLNESPITPSTARYPTYTKKVVDMNWWAYITGTSGTLAASTWNSSWGLINMTSASPTDPITGLGPYAWGAKFVNDLFHLGNYSGTSAAPTLDGFFLDNVFTQSWVDADWDRDGLTDSYNNYTVATNFRTGEKTFFDEMSLLFPSGTQLGNATFDGSISFTPLNGVMSGALIEAAIGSYGAVETYAAASGLQTAYQTTSSALKSPYYLIFGHQNVSTNGSDPVTWSSPPNPQPTGYSPAYQGVRYGITACLMGNGYYFSSQDNSYNTTMRNWFDEFDGGGLGVGYLGQPVSGSAGAVQTSAWQNGVWKREFQNGIVLWNPRGNGSQSVNLSGLGNLKRINGTQAPSVNSGGVVTNANITLQDRDGIILLKY